MTRPILVGYGTKRGSTREVAEVVAAVLRDRELSVELLPLRDVKEIGHYDAAVLGGSLYTGRWHRDARRFVKKRRAALATMPVAVFGMGPRKDLDESYRRSREQLDGALAKTPEVAPIATAVFGGVDRKREIDLRDWDAIRAWATEIGDAFASS